MKIHLRIGPMFSGKSRSLLSLQHTIQHRKDPHMVVKSTIDTRDPGIIRSRDVERSIAAYPVGMAKGFEGEFLLVDEAQFLSDDAIDMLLGVNVKHLHFFGLNADYKGNAFPAISRIMTVADHIHVMHATCDTCGAPALHSKLLENGHGKTVIIGSDQYQAACRECFYS